MARETPAVRLARAKEHQSDVHIRRMAAGTLYSDTLHCHIRSGILLDLIQHGCMLQGDPQDVARAVSSAVQRYCRDSIDNSHEVIGVLHAIIFDDSHDAATQEGDRQGNRHAS